MLSSTIAPSLLAKFSLNPMMKAFINVYYQKVGGADAICTSPWDAAKSKKPYYLAMTPAKGKKEGLSFKPCLQDMAVVKKVLENHSPEELAHGVGIGNAGAAGFVSLFAEIDDATHEEQLERWAALEKAIGVDLMLVFSGGKSVHGHLLLKGLEPISNPRINYAMGMMTVLVGGDSAIVNGATARSMRMGGYKSFDGSFEQTILKSPEKRYDLEVIIQALIAAVKKRGWPTKEAGIKHHLDLLKLAHTCLRHSEKLQEAFNGGEVPPTVQDQINQLGLYAKSLGFPSYKETYHKEATALCKKLADAALEAKAEVQLQQAQQIGPEAVEAVLTKKEAHKSISSGAGDAKYVPITFEFDVVCGLDQATVTFEELGKFSTQKRADLHGKIMLECPSCQYGHGHYFKVYWSTMGQPKAKCWHCGSVFQAEKVMEWAPITGTGFYPLPDKVEAWPGKYVDADRVKALLDDPSVRYIYERGARGSGKTTANAQATSGRITWVMTHRKALSKSQVCKYDNNMRYYLDTTPEDWADGTISISVVLDSLLKLPPYVMDANGKMVPNIPDIIIIDEAAQVLRHMVGQTVEKNVGGLVLASRLKEVLKLTPKVIFADADVDADVMGMVRRLIDRAPNLSYADEVLAVAEDAIGVNHPHKVRLWTASKRSKHALIRRIIKRVVSGMRSFIATATRADAKAICRLLVEAGVPASSILEIDGENSSEETQQGFITNPNEWLEQHQEIKHLIVSPAVGTGVDISLKDRFDIIYGLFDSSPHLVATDILQAVERVRHPNDLCVEMWVGGSRYRQATEPGAAYREIIVKEACAMGAARLAISYSQDDDNLPLPLHLEYATFMAEVSAYTALHSNDARARLLQNMAHCQWEVEQHDPFAGADAAEQQASANSTAKDLQEAKAFIRKARIEAIKNAKIPEITPALVEAAQLTLQHPASAADRHMAMKILAADTVGGEANLDDEVIELALDGELVPLLDRFLYVTAYLGNKPELLVAMNRKAASYIKRKQRGEYNHARAIITSMFGASFKAVKHEAHIDFVETKSTYKMLEKFVAYYNDLGLRTPVTITPLALLARELRQCGMAADIIRQGTHKHAVCLRVDLASVARMDLISTARKLKITKSVTTVDLNLKATVFQGDW